MDEVIYDLLPFVENNRKWHCFFAAILHVNEPDILTIWKDYSDQIGQYVISKEIADGKHTETTGEHFHFCAEMSPETYHRLSKRLFKDKYKLRGQARNGLARQYGKVSEIRDTARMIAYCLKDGDYKTNIPHDELEQYKKISFKVVKEKPTKALTFLQKITEELSTKYPDKLWDPKCYDDNEIVLDTILDRLGDITKVFDDQTLSKMYNGVINSLAMTPRDRTEYKKKWKTKIMDCYY